jgi:hypothetical protein
VYVHTHSPPSLATVIGIPTYHTPDTYTVVFKDGSISEYTESLLSAALSSSSTSPPTLLPSWVKGGANATLFLHSMSKPRHRTLQINKNNEWHFYAGKSTVGTPLPDLSAQIQCDNLDP